MVMAVEDPQPRSFWLTHRRLLTRTIVVLCSIAGLGLFWSQGGGRALERSYRDGLPLWERPDRPPWQGSVEAATLAPLRLLEQRRLGPDGGRRKLVALTFDDGPYPLHTSALLATLRRHQVPATFFLVGRRCLEYPELTRRIALDGHELANHTFTHRRESELEAGELQEEVIKTEEAIAELTGIRMNLYRPAGGSMSEEGKALVKDLGYTLVDYSVNPGDWWIKEPEMLLQGAFRGRSREGVVLLHTGNLSLVKALPVYIETMRQKGFRFVTVSELVEAVEPPLPPSPRLGQGESPGRLSL